MKSESGSRPLNCEFGLAPPSAPLFLPLTMFVLGIPVDDLMEDFESLVGQDVQVGQASCLITCFIPSH